LLLAKIAKQLSIPLNLIIIWTIRKKENNLKHILFAHFAIRKRRIIMVKKSMNAMSGIKATTQLYARKEKPNKHRTTIDSQERVDRCLECNKPANQCKGNCYGKY
jgi:hypothetical protein